MKHSIVLEKSRDFASRIIKMHQYLQQQKREFVMSKQILRSGTSIGANISEALCAQSKKDFYAKMYIAYKEASETLFWIDMLFRNGYIDDIQHKSIRNDDLELVKMLSAITKTQKYPKHEKAPNPQLLTANY
ncbi:MAG: four helix bundle protein [Bacteroidales bacterium]|nr:four helix bundle protein [Bacteroidales bacterium]MBQ2514191.1 four helix bundle protein [Bacteroidales bacterium]MBR5919604.1 four helix bundle protein [Bacteroidales bacterium]